MTELAHPTSARPVALVTGASSDIGAALAREAAGDGHDLVLVARRREPMQALAAELSAAGAEITIVSADLGKTAGTAALMEIVESRGLAIDVLINAAGLGDSGRFDQEDLGQIAAMLQVNIVALTERWRWRPTNYRNLFDLFLHVLAREVEFAGGKFTHEKNIGSGTMTQALRLLRDEAWRR